MPGFTVFYAWQSDLPEDIGKKLIRKAANDAIKQISKEMTLEDSPRLDHDTKDVSGIPIIGDTIMRKIDECGVFLADVSLVGELIDKTREPKLMPNPNVLLELGYAWARIGWKRLILVMNKKCGPQDKLPFDLRHRRFPFGFEIAEDRSDIDEQQQRLMEYIKMAFRAMLQEEHQGTSDIICKLDGHAIHILRQHSGTSHFWETVVDQNKISTSHENAIIRLLQLGVIELVPFTGGTTGFAYTWTYIGRLVLRRLSLPEPPPMQTFDLENLPPSVVTDFAMYDELKPVHVPPSKE